MTDENQEQQEQQEQQQGQEQTGSASPVGTGTAVKAVAAAAATGAAALAAKKVMSGRSSNGQSGNGDSPQQQVESGESLLSSALAGGWEAARDALLPAAEDAAGAAGEYVAQHGPDILRDRIVPRFVDSFNEARGNT
jgi:hypothetical protein